MKEIKITSAERNAAIKVGRSLGDLVILADALKRIGDFSIAETEILASLKVIKAEAEDERNILLAVRSNVTKEKARLAEIGASVLEGIEVHDNLIKEGNKERSAREHSIQKHEELVEKYQKDIHSANERIFEAEEKAKDIINIANQILESAEQEKRETSEISRNLEIKRKELTDIEVMIENAKKSTKEQIESISRNL